MLMHKEKFLSRTVLVLAGILLLVIFLRLPAVSSRFYIQDEGVTAAIGKCILNGGVLYRDVVDNRSPIGYYICALSFLLFGGTMAAAHLMLLILILLTILMLFLLSSKIWDSKTACWVALLFAVSSYSYLDTDMLAFNMEFIASFFAVIGVFFIVSYVRRRLGLFLVLSGLCFGMAFFSKQPAIFDFLAALCFIGAAAFMESGSIRRTIKTLSLLISGFCLTFLMIALYFYMNNSLREFYFWAWIYNVRYYIPASRFIDKIMVVLWFISPKSFLRENVYLLITFVVGAVMAAAKFFSRIEKAGMAALIEPYFIAWGLGAYAGTCLGGKTCGHYFIMILPPFCLIGGRCISELFAILNSETKSLPNISRKYLKAFLVTAIALQLTTPVIYYAFKRDVAGFYLKGADAVRNPLPKPFDELAAYIRDKSDEKEKIFVWGAYPEIYEEAGRRPASRHLSCIFLTGLIPWANVAPDIDTSESIIPGSWKTLIEDLKKNKPLYIIDTSPGGYRAFGKYPIVKFKDLFDFMNERYVLDKEFYNEYGNLSFKVFKRN